MASTCRAAALAVLFAAGCATPGGGSNVPRAGEDEKADGTSSKSPGVRGGVLDAETARAETDRILEGIAKARNLGTKTIRYSALACRSAASSVRSRADEGRTYAARFDPAGFTVCSILVAEA